MWYWAGKVNVFLLFTNIWSNEIIGIIIKPTFSHGCIINWPPKPLKVLTDILLHSLGILQCPGSIPV